MSYFFAPNALAARLAGGGVGLIVDSSLAPPAVLRPMGLGASVVLHSATKFISGHGDVTAGVVGGSRAVVERVRAAEVRVGTNLSPFDCWLAARGLRTLHVRLERQCANALVLGRFLEGRPEVQRVYYPGLPSHPQHGLAARLFKNGAGAMLSFDLGGGAPAVERLVTRLRLIEFAPSFGDVATTWTYPARTSHRRISAARMASVKKIKEIMATVTIPAMAKCRIGHFVEAQILQALAVDYIDESEVLTPADERFHVDKFAFTVPFVCGARDLGEALRRIGEGAAMIRTKGEAGPGTRVDG